MISLNPFELFYYAAAAWAVSYMLTSTQGAGGMFVKLREWRKGKWHGRIYNPEYTISTLSNSLVPEPDRVLGGDIKYHGLLDCIICTMPWVALILHIIGVNIITDALAIAGIALWVHGFTNWRVNM